MELVFAAILAALAIARLTTLIVHDTILDRLRHEVFLLSPPPDDLDRGFLYQQWSRVPFRHRRPFRRSTGQSGVSGTFTIRRGVPPRRTGVIGTLLSCDRCVGLWVTLGVLGGYVAFPVAAFYIVAVLGLAQAAIIATRAGE